MDTTQQQTPTAPKAESKKEALQGIYEDFRTTMKAVVGDFESTIGKHKILLIISFLVFLAYRNKQLTVDQFVKSLEKKLLKDGDVE